MSDLVERLLAEEDRLDNEAAARITELEAENARLREALNEIARQPLAEAMNDEDLERASFEDGYDYCVRHARALMAAAKEADEAATKRERERASAVVAEIAGHYRDSSASFKAAKIVNGAAISDGIARLLDDVVVIIKGEP